MSLVVLVLFGIVLFNMVRGYQRGVLMVLYSIAAWVVILIAANGLAPRVKDFMVNHTGIYHSIEQSCEKTINDRLSQSVDEQLDHTGEDTAGEYCRIRGFICQSRWLSSWRTTWHRQVIKLCRRAALRSMLQNILRSLY